MKPITYNIIKYSDKADQDIINKGVQQGFKLWSDVTPLQFQQTEDTSDIEIEFSDNHDTFLKDPMCAGQAKDERKIFLNNKFYWSLDGANTTIKKDGVTFKVITRNLPVIISHEFGHLKGLTHNSNPDSIMKTGNLSVTRPSSNDIKAMGEALK